MEGGHGMGGMEDIWSGGYEVGGGGMEWGMEDIWKGACRGVWRGECRGYGVGGMEEGGM